MFKYGDIWWQEGGWGGWWRNTVQSECTGSSLLRLDAFVIPMTTSQTHCHKTYTPVSHCYTGTSHVHHIFVYSGAIFRCGPNAVLHILIFEMHMQTKICAKAELGTLRRPMTFTILKPADWYAVFTSLWGKSCCWSNSHPLNLIMEIGGVVRQFHHNLAGGLKNAFNLRVGKKSAGDSRVSVWMWNNQNSELSGETMSLCSSNTTVSVWMFTSMSSK